MSPPSLFMTMTTIPQIPMPPVPDSVTEESVEFYAMQCIEWLRLEGWSFGFDRATRRLGCCRPQQQRITLSRHLVQHSFDEMLVWRTLLHELAHALAWKYHRCIRHSGAWKNYCAALGIPGERATVSEETLRAAFTKGRPVRYILCHADTGEIYRIYARRPRISPEKLSKSYLPGRKEETLGKLVIRDLGEGIYAVPK